MHFRQFSKDLVSIHVWRQTQTQSTIVNFFEEDMNILNPRINNRGSGDGISRMEFPLMQWTVACIYKVFGNEIIITRICMFLIGLFSILGLYKLLRNLFHNEIIALMGAWTFNFSPCFFYYTINPIPDNLALCLSIWGVAIFMKWRNTQRLQTLILSGLFLCFGSLCKLPFIVYFSIPFIYFIIPWKNKITYGNIYLSLSIFLFFILFPLMWYTYVVPGWGGNIIVLGMLDNQLTSKELIDALTFNLISTLPEMLLNYGSLLFFISGFYFIFKNKEFKKAFFITLIVWSLSVLSYYLFEMNAIGRVHDYYLFPFLPILFIIVAYGAYNLFNSTISLKYITLVVLIILPLTAYLRMQKRWDINSPGFNKDLLTYKNELRNSVPKDALCIAGNDISQCIMFYYIDKKGWAFCNDTLEPGIFKAMINDGAQYLFSDSRILEKNSEVAPFLGEQIAETGSIKVFNLINKRK